MTYQLYLNCSWVGNYDTYEEVEAKMNELSCQGQNGNFDVEKCD